MIRRINFSQKAIQFATLWTNKKPFHFTAIGLIIMISGFFFTSANAQFVHESYTIRVVTADYKYAGTDADIKIRLHGLYGVTDWHEIDTRNHDDFEQGNTDEYVFMSYEITDVGPVHMIDVKKINSDEWRLETIEVVRTNSFFKGNVGQNEIEINTTYYRKDGSSTQPIFLADKVTTMSFDLIGFGSRWQGGLVWDYQFKQNKAIGTARLIMETNFGELSWDAAKQGAGTCNALGFSDWKLLSKDLMKKVYDNMYVTGAGSFTSFPAYWCSTEGSNNNAYECFFNRTETIGGLRPKGSLRSVRYCRDVTINENKYFLPLSGADELVPEKKYHSADGKYYLQFGVDGNVVVRPKNGGFVWGTYNNSGAPLWGKSARMRADGNFCIYSDDMDLLWETNTNTSGSKLSINSSGQLVILGPNNNEIWNGSN